MQIEEKKIRKVGNSVVITIPKDFLERTGIKAGEVVDVNNDAWDALIKKKESSREAEIALYSKKSLQKYETAYKELINR